MIVCTFKFHRLKQPLAVLLKRLCHGQKCLHSFLYSEAYHEQTNPIPRSNESLDIALSNAHT